MKRILSIASFVFLISSTCYAGVSDYFGAANPINNYSGQTGSGYVTDYSKSDFEPPVPSDAEVMEYNADRIPNGDLKYSKTTQLRYEAFNEVVPQINTDEFNDMLNLPIYDINENGEIIKNKHKNMKVIEYTDGTYSVIRKGEKNKEFFYSADGKLYSFALHTNNKKVPYYTYYYDLNGYVSQIEVHPLKNYSYIYDLNGILVKYVVDHNCYDVKGQIILQRKTLF